MKTYRAAALAFVLVGWVYQDGKSELGSLLPQGARLVDYLEYSDSFGDFSKALYVDRQRSIYDTRYPKGQHSLALKNGSLIGREVDVVQGFELSPYVPKDEVVFCVRTLYPSKETALHLILTYALTERPGEEFYWFAFRAQGERLAKVREGVGDLHLEYLITEDINGDGLLEVAIGKSGETGTSESVEIYVATPEGELSELDLGEIRGLSRRLEKRGDSYVLLSWEETQRYRKILYTYSWSAKRRRFELTSVSRAKW